MYSESRTYRVTPLVIPALLALLALSAVGCGKKGPPLPPLRNVPAATTDLTIVQEGRQILFEMGYPATTVSGMALGGIDSVELYVLTKPADVDGPEITADPREMESDAELLLTLLGTELRTSIVGNKIQFRLPLQDQLPEESTANIFAVRTTKNSEPSTFSNRVTLIPLEPPEAPEKLVATPKPTGIELTWETDVEAKAFDIFRRFATERGYGEPLTRVPGSKTSYFDRNAKYGQRYIYTVRTVIGDDAEIASRPAGDREVDFDDRFPPELPKNFVALPERGSVRLRWDSSASNDAAGYLIFRKDPFQEGFVQVTTDPIQGTEYVDRGLSSGLTFRYKIQVIDGAGNKSKPSDPIAATTR